MAFSLGPGGALEFVKKKLTSIVSATLQLDSANSGVKLKNNAGVFEVRNAADTALAGLRCSPFYNPYSRSLVVDAGGGGDYTTIQAACDYINTQTHDANNQWVICIEAGIYTENVVLPSWTHIKGEVGRCCGVQITSSSGDTLTLPTSGQTKLSDIRVASTSTTGADRAIKGATGTLELFLEDIYVSRTIDGVSVAISAFELDDFSKCRIRHVAVDLIQTNVTVGGGLLHSAMYFSGSGELFIWDTEITAEGSDPSDIYTGIDESTNAALDLMVSNSRIHVTAKHATRTGGYVICYYCHSTTGVNRWLSGNHLHAKSESSSSDATICIANTDAAATVNVMGNQLLTEGGGSQYKLYSWGGNIYSAFNVNVDKDDTAGTVTVCDTTGTGTFQAEEWDCLGRLQLHQKPINPPAVAEVGLLYTVDGGGITELAYTDSSGNDIQITTAGSLNIGGFRDSGTDSTTWAIDEDAGSHVVLEADGTTLNVEDEAGNKTNLKAAYIYSCAADGTIRGYVYPSGDDLVVLANADDLKLWSSAGDVQIGYGSVNSWSVKASTRHFTPNTTDTFDIGTSSLGVRNIYFGNGTTAATAGAYFAPRYIVKTDSGDPASGRSGDFCENTFDNTLKVYADGAWRSITTW